MLIFKIIRQLLSGILPLTSLFHLVAQLEISFLKVTQGSALLNGNRANQVAFPFRKVGSKGLTGFG